MTFLEYAPAPESTSILDLQDEYGLFIDGEWTAGSGTPFASVSPSTEERIATFAAADEGDVDRAVRAARRAFERTWGPMSGRDRGKYLYRIARIVQERARELAVAETLDNGKPIRETRDADVPLVAQWFFHCAGWADKLDWVGLGARPQPLGVAAQVIPSFRDLNLPEDKVNINGGAIAVGHPFGMTGARITTTLLNSLDWHDKSIGLETMCVGGGQGMAMIVERLS